MAWRGPLVLAVWFRGLGKEGGSSGTGMQVTFLWRPAVLG